ncbi:hypothetical protein H4Q26_004233 [Puccinia striiformis f. sp. tritici PST-130]|nr:hypothetical protein H4Q26_004233 [Puccinia striiformis f. sp. tritici PST-130]
MPAYHLIITILDRTHPNSSRQILRGSASTRSAGRTPHPTPTGLPGELDFRIADTPTYIPTETAGGIWSDLSQAPTTRLGERWDKLEEAAPLSPTALWYEPDSILPPSSAAGPSSSATSFTPAPTLDYRFGPISLDWIDHPASHPAFFPLGAGIADHPLKSSDSNSRKADVALKMTKSSKKPHPSSINSQKNAQPSTSSLPATKAKYQLGSTEFGYGSIHLYRDFEEASAAKKSNDQKKSQKSGPSARQDSLGTAELLNQWNELNDDHRMIVGVLAIPSYMTSQAGMDYVGDNYVHRLIQTKSDQIVELPALSSAVFDSGGDSQRAFYEEEMEILRNQLQTTQEEAEEQKSLVKKLQTQLQNIEESNQSLEKLKIGERIEGRTVDVGRNEAQIKKLEEEKHEEKSKTLELSKRSWISRNNFEIVSLDLTHIPCLFLTESNSGPKVLTFLFVFDLLHDVLYRNAIQDQNNEGGTSGFKEARSFRFTPHNILFIDLHGQPSCVCWRGIAFVAAVLFIFVGIATSHLTSVPRHIRFVQLTTKVWGRPRERQRSSPCGLRRPKCADNQRNIGDGLRLFYTWGLWNRCAGYVSTSDPQYCTETSWAYRFEPTAALIEDVPNGLKDQATEFTQWSIQRRPLLWCMESNRVLLYLYCGLSRWTHLTLLAHPSPWSRKTRIIKLSVISLLALSAIS